jgi:hypothetical protein
MISARSRASTLARPRTSASKYKRTVAGLAGRLTVELPGDRPAGVGYLLKRRVADVDAFLVQCPTPPGPGTDPITCPPTDNHEGGTRAHGT